MTDLLHPLADYRPLAEGERIRFGDEGQTESGEWTLVGACWVGCPWSSGLFLPHRRPLKLDPTIKYNPEGRTTWADAYRELYGRPI